MHTRLYRRYLSPQRRHNGLVFIVGSPGTGKTSGVDVYLEDLANGASWINDLRPMSVPRLKILRLKAFSFASLVHSNEASRLALFVEEFLKSMKLRISGTDVRESLAHVEDMDDLLDLLSDALGENPMVLCIDEFDQLASIKLMINSIVTVRSKSKRSMMKFDAHELLTDLVLRHPTKCVLLGISNEQAIADHIKSYVPRSASNVHSILFKPYTYDQLRELYAFRTGSDKLETAVEYGIRKIASKKGDSRLVLDLLARLHIQSRPSSPTRADTEDDFHIPGSRFVSRKKQPSSNPQTPTIETVDNLFGMTFAPELKRLVNQLQSLPAQHQLIVCACYRLMLDKAPQADADVGNIWISCKAIYTLYRRLRSQLDGGSELLSYAAFQNGLQALAMAGVLCSRARSALPRTPLTPKTPMTAIRRKNTPRRQLVSVP